MKRTVVIVVIVLLALFAASGWALVVVSQVQLQLARQNAAELQQGRNAAETALGTAQSELEDCSEETARVQAESDECLRQVHDLEVDAAFWERLYTTQEAAYACYPEPPEIDYTNQDTVSASLEAYVDRNRTDVDSARWFVIWDGLRTAAIHQLVGSDNVMYVYIAWLEDAQWGFHNRVFGVSAQCWLDPGE